MILLQLLLGWLIADALSGVFHYWQDHTSGWLLRDWLVEPARLHHAFPLAFTEGSFAYRNWATVAFSGAVATLWLLFLGPSWVLAAAFAGGSLSTQIHYLAHRPSLAPGWYRWLQKTGIVQSPKQHSGHHRPPHLYSYCIVTDWLNPVLNLWKVKS